MMTRKVGVVIAGLVALAVTGCASSQRPVASATGWIPGLTSGPLPEPKPWVVSSRPAQSDVYPTIGYTPPPRAEKPMTVGEVRDLDEGLQAAAGVKPKKKKVVLPVPAQ